MGQRAHHRHANSCANSRALTAKESSANILHIVVIRPRLSTQPYLLVLIVGIVGSQFMDYLTRSNPWLYGQSAGILLPIGATATATLLWFFTSPSGRMTGLPLWTFLGFTALWILVFVSSRLDGASFTYAALATPVILVLMIFNPPRIPESWRVADFAFGLIAALSLFAQLLDWLGIRSSRTTIYSRWSIPFTDVDLGYRWEGFFGDPNNAGLIGAILLIYGLHRRGWLRIALISAGFLIAAFAESRTALLAIAAGALTTMLTSQRYRTLRIRPIFTWIAILAISVLTVALVLLTNPTFNGRSQIWESYLTIWSTNPLIGVGSSGIDAAIADGQVPWDTIDGHSVLIDALTRHGVLVGLLVLVLLITIITLTARVVRVDSGTSLSIVVVWLFGALTYTLTPWLYVNVLTLPLVLSLLIAQAHEREESRAAST